MISNVHDPRSTDDLADVEAWPFADGAEQVSIRVSRRKPDGTPACYQATVKGQDGSRPPSVGMLACPIAALNRAITEFYRNPTAEPSVDDLLG
ncbi:hypothetical protein [Shimia sp.]|uniref:hypothetical protein n=1 Tax=Shimia sp. TaxID=1954381 RepID=UPI00329958C7